MEILPPSAYGSFVEELDPKELAEIVKWDPQMADRVFHGFRPGPQSVKTPVVRQRIAREMERDPAFREVLFDFWEDSHSRLLDFVAALPLDAVESEAQRIAQVVGGTSVYLALMLDGRKGLAKLASKRGPDLLKIQADLNLVFEPAAGDVAAAERKPDRAEKAQRDLKAAKDRVAQLMKENRTLDSQLKSARKAVERAEKDAAKQRSEAEEARREQARISHRADVAARERDEALHKAAESERTVKELRKALDSSAGGSRPERELPASPWQDAVDRLLRARNYESAIDFLEALAQCSSDDPRPHDILARAYRAAGEIDSQTRELIWLGRHYLSTGSVGAAADRICRALVAAPDDPAVADLLSEAFARTSLRNERRMSDVRKVLSRLRQAAPEAFARAMAVAERTSPALAAALQQSPRQSQVERIFSIENGREVRHLSPRQVVAAVDRNEVETVSFLRAALDKLRKGFPDTFQTIHDAIRECDPSCSVTLAVETHPVVVDASNVAYHLTTADGKPRLRNIVLLRRELRRRGYFPIYIYADAALPYQIDRPSELQQMMESGEVELADAKTDADEMILDRARRLGCPVVTRDWMTDWDPDGAVTKIRFDLDRESAVLFE